jgi:sterol desaturase/sphingolipid hydroxylase (fatty acid hydroxylase superfamily)
MNELFDAINVNRRWISLSVLIVLLQWETFAPFFGFFRRKPKQRLVHGITNVVMSAINTGLIIFVFIVAWAWAADLSAEKGWGLLHRFQAAGWLEMIIAVLCFDLFTYWFHRMSHRIPLMWRFHRVHHSDPHMDVTTASRFHFGEIIISSVLRVGLILLVGAELWHLALYEAIMFPIVQFHHANVVVPPWLDRILRVFIVTPAMHKVHHSRIQQETDSNYTSLLSIWDRLFGSFRRRTDLHEINLGLEGYDSPTKQSLIGMLKTPKD